MALFSLLLGLVPLLLLSVGLYFGVRLRFFPFLHPLRTLKTLLGAEGGSRTASLRATATALAGTIGVGNMAGVSVALLVGGAGAIFWMWVSALAAMLLKYAEITLALDSRPEGGKGGTPHSFRAAGHPKLARLFALLCLLNTLLLGGAVQTGAVCDCFSDSFGMPSTLTGALLLLAALPALLGGAKRIFSFTARLVPLMCLLYLGGACLVILHNIEALPSAIGRIFSGAFSSFSVGGGILGFLSARALREGAARGLMSNEGGCGTSPLAHATATPREPAEQGLFGILEVGIDTLLICTVTALAVLTAFDPLPTGLSGLAMLRAAFSDALGPLGGLLVTVSLALFAYGTVLCEAFYGEACADFLSEKRPVCREYRFFFCAALLLGAWLPGGALWFITDLLLAAMTCLNLYLLLRRADRIVALTRRAKLILPKNRTPCVAKAKKQVP